MLCQVDLPNHGATKIYIRWTLTTVPVPTTCIKDYVWNTDKKTGGKGKRFYQ